MMTARVIHIYNVIFSYDTGTNTMSGHDLSQSNTLEHEEDHDRGIRWLYKTNIYLISLPDTMLTCCSPKQSGC